MASVEIYTEDGELSGLISMNGEEVIPCIYLEAFQWSKDHIYVHLKGDETSKIVDRKGNQVAWISKYDDVGLFVDVLTPVVDGLAPVWKEKKYGMVDMEGNLVIPCVYDYYLILRKGDSLVPTKLGDKWGAIDRDQNVVIPFQYSEPIKALGENRYLINISSSQKIIVDEFNNEVFRLNKQEKRDLSYRFFFIAIVIMCLLFYFFY